ncbi:hypothetical protein CYMTET_19777 [Cymbomonas tetramitiformis]|uniref:tRNA/rRNA methyltransferase SpoU type domain-containing protein n=1 Tax=Cymbomonas tetramitiformis TaxID=36881 RepID=A0AAE0G5X1_9CHLO|nr:hypothetical protein CYMTET_19777 [Cymbomonas tetramitiformis]
MRQVAKLQFPGYCGANGLWRRARCKSSEPRLNPGLGSRALVTYQNTHTLQVKRSVGSTVSTRQAWGRNLTCVRAGQAVFDEPWEFAKSNLHVVLVNPQIPGNTGSTARTCAAAQVPLHLVGPLGFDIDDKAVKRAGLDYWPYVFVKLHETWDDFYEYFKQQEGEKRLVGFSKSGARAHWEPGAYRPGDWLLFGSEVDGLPPGAWDGCRSEEYGGGLRRIPIVEDHVRSLNLSVSVGVGVYEAQRQIEVQFDTPLVSTD